VTVLTEETLLQLLKASCATLAEMEDVERDISWWGRDTTLIEVKSAK
jgi:hypothetical protein